jgi:hypothetical protein
MFYILGLGLRRINGMKINSILFYSILEFNLVIWIVTLFVDYQSFRGTIRLSPGAGGGMFP